MSQLSLRQLEIFRAIMRSGSLTGAAKALAISQPAASRLLRHAEDQIGMRLFQRRSGRLVPTEEARALYPEVDRIFGEVDYVQRVALDLQRLRAGRLRIATISTIAATLVAGTAGSFAEAHPSVTISTANLLNFHVTEHVLDRRADIGLAFQPLNHEGVNVETILTTEIVAVLPPGHPLGNLDQITMKDLADCRLISFSNSLPLGLRVEEAFRASGVSYPMSLEVGHSFIACAFVRAGAGVALIDRLALQNAAFSDLVVKPVAPRLEISAVLLTPKDRGLSMIASAFIDSLRGVAHKLQT